jgi:hypothetical protein
MRSIDDLFGALRRSSFRARFRLGPKERAYLQSKGIETILEHARQFIDERLAPANPKNDGKQTPMRNHPVFIAQHATATCCRGCLEKWHGIPRGRELSDAERAHVVEVIHIWLSRGDGKGPQNP